MHRVDVGARPDAHFAELPATLGIRLDATLSREDAVAQGLQLIADSFYFGIKGGNLFAGSGDFDLLLGDFPLIERAGFGTLLDLLGHLGD